MDIERMDIDMSAPRTFSAVESAPDMRSLRALTWILAAACGLAVANLYYCQPLLNEIAKTFHAGQGEASVVVTLTQLGYAIGLVFVVPLGDLLENRALASRTLLVTAAALILAGLAPNLELFLAASVLIGVTSVVAQILIPLAAHLAPAAERGRLVGRVMSGLLGILLARTVASLVSAALGWRSIFFISAGLIVATSLVLARKLPRHRPVDRPSYVSLLASLGELVRNEPALRRRAACQASMFGAFSAFWTSVTFELIDSHGLSQTGIGIFALVGAAGALAAPAAGRIADRGLGGPASGIALLLGSVSMILAAIAGGHGTPRLVLLAASAVLLDLAVQGHQVLSQQEIYQLREDARARLNTVFMGSIFTTGAISSAVGGWLHEQYGWVAVMIFAAALPLGGLTIWAVSGLRRGRALRGPTS
jgi:predicted MFS family arabinose efflux permease